MTEDLIPWDLPAEVRLGTTEALALSALAQKRQGLEITEQAEGRIKSLLEALERNGTVLSYRPDAGFFEIPRVESDGDNVVRP